MKDARVRLQPTVRRRRMFILFLLGFWALVLVLLVLFLPVWLAARRANAAARPVVSTRIDPAQLRDGDEHPFIHDRAFVWDRDVYVRPREGFTGHWMTTSIDGERRVVYRMTHFEHGIVRYEPLGANPGRPLILLLGDSQTYGVDAPQRNVYYLLERDLRSRPGLEHATVVNAACPYYSLYQYVVRARSLWERLKPDLVVVILFVGNDLLELEDLSRPHIDDGLNEQPHGGPAPGETTSARLKLFKRSVPAPYEGLFWQGMNQAIYFRQRAERRGVVMAKARRALELLAAKCRAEHVGLIVGLLPPFEDVVDYRLSFDVDPFLQDVLAQRSSRELRLELYGMVRELGVPVVDFFDVLRSSSDPDLYAGDFHLWAAGHALLAEALRPAIEEALLR